MANERPEASDPLQFERAEFVETPEALACAQCRQPIASTYYTVNGQVVCAACQVLLRVEQGAGSGLGRFVRATLFGGLAGSVGTAIWYAIAALFNIELSLIAILIGFMVGGAVRAGSRGRGGWLFQGLAMFLTYTSIVAAYVPFITKGLREQAKQSEVAPAATPSTQVADEAGKRAAPAEAPAPAAATAPAAPPTEAPAEFSLAGLALALFVLAALAYAAPFLGGFENALGWVIIAIGLYEAWKINKRHADVITGPHRVGTTPAPGHAGV